MLRDNDTPVDPASILSSNNDVNEPPVEKKYSLKDLLDRASQLLENREIDNAEIFVRRALESWGRTPEALDLMANITLEKGDWEGAYQQFHEILEISKPKGWASTHMSLGQMTTEMESVSHYQKGIQLYLEKVSQNVLSEDELFDVKRKVSNGFVSLTEIYLTDLCFEEYAEKNCENYLSQALELDPRNPEVLQALASVRLSQDRKQDAQNCLTNSFELWYNQDVVPPPHPARLALARIMIEAELYDSALLVLENLEKEDDQEVDVWYLYGLVNLLIAKKSEGQPDLDSCTESWGCLAMACRVAEKHQYEDVEVLGHIKEMQSELMEYYPSLVNEGLEEEDCEGIEQGDLDISDTDDEEDRME